MAVHWQVVVKSILSRVWETGDIYKAKYEGNSALYLVSHYHLLLRSLRLGIKVSSLNTH